MGQAWAGGEQESWLVERREYVVGIRGEQWRRAVEQGSVGWGTVLQGAKGFDSHQRIMYPSILG